MGVRLGGSTLHFNLCPRTTAGMLKNKLFEDLCMSPECLTLFFKSQMLDDSTLLASLANIRRAAGVSLTCLVSGERVYAVLGDPATSLPKKRRALRALADVARSDYQRAIKAHVLCLREDDRLILEIAVEGFVRMAQDGGEEVKRMVLETAFAGMEDEKSEAVRASCVEVVGRVSSPGDN